LLKEAWGAGKVSRLTLVLGLIVSVAWASAVAAGTVWFIAHTIRQPALPLAYKVILPSVVTVAVVFLLMFLPTQWLAYALLRLAERRRNEARPKL
jgi:hypothetical protein